MRTVASEVNPSRIQLRHSIDASRVRQMRSAMVAEDGWRGRPIVLYAGEDGQLRNITGCHRTEAARRLRLRVPAIILMPETPDEHDTVAFAAANDDVDAAQILHSIDEYVVDLVLAG